MALLGRVDHSLDEKGRLVVPAIFRDDLAGKLFFALGDENEVAVWPEAEFNEKLEQKKARERESREGAREFRRFTAFAGACKMDAQFRIAIPESLRVKAGLGRDVTIAGASSRIEIWDRAAHLAYFEAEALSEAAG
jgi:MraZ protein